MERTVIIPAHNEAQTVAEVVRCVLADADEVIVVASCCTDETAPVARAAGARVTIEAEPGKHRALRRGLSVASGELVAFIDADLVTPPPDIARRLFDAIRGPVAMAKGYYRRHSNRDEARLTEICARPLLAVLGQRIAAVRDPLCGEYAARRADARRWYYAPGFAVDLGFLLQAWDSGIAEVSLGEKKHKHRPVHLLGQAAVQVIVTLMAGSSFFESQLPSTPQDLPQWIDDRIHRTPVDIGFLPPLEGAHEDA